MPPVYLKRSIELKSVPGGVFENRQEAASLVLSDIVVALVPDGRVPIGAPLDRVGGVMSLELLMDNVIGWDTLVLLALSLATTVSV